MLQSLKAHTFESLSGSSLDQKLSMPGQHLSRWNQGGSLDVDDTEEIRDDGATMKKASQEWLKSAFKDALAAKDIAASRSDAVLKDFTQSFVVDVRGTIQKATSEVGPHAVVSDFSMSRFTDNLVAMSKDALSRRQQLCFQRLLYEVILPFYEEHSNLWDLRSCEGDESIKIPDLKKLLENIASVGMHSLQSGSNVALGKDVAESTRGRLRESGNSSSPANVGRKNVRPNKERANKLFADIKKDFIDKNHTILGDEVKERWDADNSSSLNESRFPDDLFKRYRTSRSRQVGDDIKSVTPEATLLKDLLIPEVAHDITLPLQESLRALKDELISTPIEGIVELLEVTFKKSLSTASPRVSNSLELLLSASLRKWGEQEKHAYAMQFAEQLKRIPVEREAIMRDVMTKKLQALRKLSNNKDRKAHLAKNANDLSVSITQEMIDFVDFQILEVVQSRLHKSFERVARSCHALMVAATKEGDTAELERLDAFATSQKYARFTAGLIKAVHESELGRDLVKDYTGLDKILQLADQPMGLLKDGMGLNELTQPADQPDDTGASGSSSVVPPTIDSCSPAMPPDQLGITADEWSCANCYCSADDYSGARTPLPLTKTCRFSPGTCWCEKLDQTKTYCRLCVRYYRSKSADQRQCVARPASAEKAYRRRKAMPTPAKRRSSDGGAAPSAKKRKMDGPSVQEME